MRTTASVCRRRPVDSKASSASTYQNSATPSVNLRTAYRLMIGVIGYLMIAAAPLSAQIITVPDDLNPGDTYRLVFITEGETLATSPNIADYNAFVTAEANSVPELNALGTTWTAIGSTSSVDARDNTNTNPTVGLGHPIYDLGGTFRASDNADLWDPSDNTNIAKTQTGEFNGGLVWTGTQPDGSADPANYLGAFNVNRGHIGLAEIGAWVASGTSSASGLNPLYGISGPLTVVPEPSSIFLAGLSITFAFSRWRCS